MKTTSKGMEPRIDAVSPCALVSLRLAAILLSMAGIAGCTTIVQRDHLSRTPSTALAQPQSTALGRHFSSLARSHDGSSGFHVITAGVDGFVVRMQMIHAAEKTLDLQYYIFRGDETGLMVARELLHAAERGVRIRLLVDDADSAPGDERILALGTHPNIEVRVFNPFDYRGHNELLRNLDFAAHMGQLDYRMHNKLLVVDNSIALIGGRNIGNQYFQLDPESQFADEDVFAAGPIAQDLSATFDEFWNSALAVPMQALGGNLDEQWPARPPALKGSGIDYLSQVATGLPYADLVGNEAALTWAHARVVCDSPNKKDVKAGKAPGKLMTPEVLASMRAVQSELDIVSAFFVPTDGEVALLEDLRRRGVRVRVLSNSLESTPQFAAYSGYSSYRVPLLEQGVELYEVRSLLDSVRGSGETRRVARYGNYALHAKLYVFDRKSLFIGSMNFDQRSYRINTEIGLLLDSTVLAEQTAKRFDAMVGPRAAYRLELRAREGKKPSIIWRTEIDGRLAEFEREPARSGWQRGESKLLALFPIQREL